MRSAIRATVRACSAGTRFQPMMVAWERRPTTFATLVGPPALRMMLLMSMTNCVAHTDTIGQRDLSPIPAHVFYECVSLSI